MPKKETISVRILKLLNLESEFEMSYEEYSRHLKEALIAARLTKSKFSTEEAEILTEEYKRVKNKKGRFTINPKKERRSSSPIPRLNQKKLPGTAEKRKENIKKFLTGSKVSKVGKVDQVEKKDKTVSILEKISSTVDKIHKNVLNLTKIIASSDEKERIQRTRAKRKAKEARLEKKSPLDGIIEATKGILKPFKSIWDRIIQFLTFTFLGRLWTMFTDWVNNPDNKKKVDTLFRFLKDFAPALAGAAFLFLTPFGKFIRTVIGFVGKLSARLLLKGIPALIKFIKNRPLAAAAVVTTLAAGKLYLDSRGAGEEAIKEKEEELGRKLTKEEETQAVQEKFLANPILGPLGNFMIPTLTQQVTADDKPEDEKNLGDRALDIGGGLFDFANQFLPDFSGIFTGEYKKGGVFSGLVDKNTGTRVPGFGKDTQFLPMADGKSGVVVQPGEIVMNKEQQEKLAADTGVDPREYVPGPKKGKIQKFNTGGIIGSNPNYRMAYDTISNNFPSAEPYHIAAALGNFETEAPGLKPNTYQLENGPGRGIAQWEIDHPGNKNTGRWPTAEKMYGKNVINSLKDQLNFMKWEMDTGHPLPDGRPNLPYGFATKSSWLNTTNLTDATKQFMLAYEAPSKPHYERRLDNAKQFLDLSETFETQKPKSKPTLSQSFSPLKKEKEKENNTDTKHNIFDTIKKVYGKYESFRDSDDGKALQSILRSLLGFKGGGKIKEGTGVDIPGATDDRQLISVKVQPGEYLRVFTKDFVDRGGMKVMDQLQSSLDSDSNARKSGVQPLDMKRYIPESPSTSNGGIQIINLPTEVISSRQPSSPTKQMGTVPSFSATSSAAEDNRMAIAKIYGMME